MRTHIQVLGWLHVVMHGLYVVLGGLFFVLFSAGGAAIAATGGHDGVATGGVIGAFGLMTCLILLIIGLPGTVVGYALVRGWNWGRIGGIILSILNLMVFPLGTIVGVYGLWVLLNSETTAIFEGRHTHAI